MVPAAIPCEKSDDNCSINGDFDNKGTTSHNSLCDNDCEEGRNNDVTSQESHELKSPNAEKSIELPLGTCNDTGSVVISCDDNNKGKWVYEMSTFGLSPSRSLNNSWQTFSKRGERFKTILDEAFVKVLSAPGASSLRQPLSRVDQENESLPHIDKDTNGEIVLVNDNCHILQKLIQEKQIECLLLQQKIDFQTSDIAQLEAMVGNLRESKKQHAGNETHLRMALKRASQNATLARDEANKAEFSAATLATQVEAFGTIVQETKRASMLLLKEQDDIGIGVEGMEKKLLRVQSDLVRSNAIKKRMKQKESILNNLLRHAKNRVDELQDNLELERSESLLTKRKYKELEVSAQIQLSQSKSLQEELYSTQTLLIDSTSAAAESKLALQNCNHALYCLEEANQNLHLQAQENQALLQKQEISHQEEITRAEKEHHEKKLQLNSQKYKFRNLKVEKLAADKRQESLAAKIFALERRLKELTNLMPATVAIPTTNSDSMARNSLRKDTDSIGNFECSNRGSSKTNDIDAIPRLGSEENKGILNATKKCYICHKGFSGLMKKCECGRKGCESRAHATCVHRVFVGASTPNTSAPAHAPVILCRSSTHHYSEANICLLPALEP